MERKTPEELFGEVFVDLGLTPEQKAGARMNPPEHVEASEEPRSNTTPSLRERLKEILGPTFSASKLDEIEALVSKPDATKVAEAIKVEMGRQAMAFYLVGPC